MFCQSGTFYLDSTVLRELETCNYLQKRAFTGTVGTEYGNLFTTSNSQGYIFQGDDAISIGIVHVFKLDHHFGTPLPKLNRKTDIDR